MASEEGPGSSRRWNPTQQQKEILRDLYFNQGLRHPRRGRLEEVMEMLRPYGHVEAKNVIHWFKNKNNRTRPADALPYQRLPTHFQQHPEGHSSSTYSQSHSASNGDNGNEVVSSTRQVREELSENINRIRNVEPPEQHPLHSLNLAMNPASASTSTSARTDRPLMTSKGPAVQLLGAPLILGHAQFPPTNVYHPIIPLQYEAMHVGNANMFQMIPAPHFQPRNNDQSRSQQREHGQSSKQQREHGQSSKQQQEHGQSCKYPEHVQSSQQQQHDANNQNEEAEERTGDEIFLLEMFPLLPSRGGKDPDNWLTQPMGRLPPRL